jgi:transcription antitermination factor NusG
MSLDTVKSLLPPGIAWLAVWTKPRAEKSVARILEAQSVPYWLPTLTVRRRWSDRWKEVELPLFPGYLFAQSSLDRWSTLLLVPGVLTVVKDGRRPAWISPRQLVSMQLAVEHFVRDTKEPGAIVPFERGDVVRVIDGPLAGLIGVVREIRGSRRILVGFEQIGQALSVSLGAANVERYSE